LSHLRGATSAVPPSFWPGSLRPLHCVKYSPHEPLSELVTLGAAVTGAEAIG